MDQRRPSISMSAYRDELYHVIVPRQAGLALLSGHLLNPLVRALAALHPGKNRV
jgi:hypothetical protein